MFLQMSHRPRGGHPRNREFSGQFFKLVVGTRAVSVADVPDNGIENGFSSRRNGFVEGHVVRESQGTGLRVCRPERKYPPDEGFY